MNELINVAAYCRVSTDEADQLHSLSAQIKYFTDYISGQPGWRLKEVYFDEGISGTSVKKRAAFNRMIRDAENGEIGLILTKEVSRFARNTVDTLQFTRKLTSLKVGVIFMNDGIDTRDKDGELRLTIMASIAQEESRKTSERVKWGIKRKMEAGFVCGTKLIGFALTDGILTVIPEEAEIVKRIFYSYLYEKKSLTTIANDLNEDEILSPKGSLWNKAAIKYCLENEKYCGDLVQYKSYTIDHLTHERNKKNNGEIPKIEHADHHEGIISREMWEAVQAELERRSLLRNNKGHHSVKYWFSKKIECGECGKSFTSQSLKEATFKTLKCTTRNGHGKEKRVLNGIEVGCSNKAINTIILISCMQYVLKHIQNFRDDIVSDLLCEIQIMQQRDEPVDTAKLESEIENFSRKKKKAIDLMLDDLITKKDLREQTAYYDGEIERLTLEIHNSKNSNAVYENQINEIKKCIDEVEIS